MRYIDDNFYVGYPIVVKGAGNGTGGEVSMAWHPVVICSVDHFDTEYWVFSLEFVHEDEWCSYVVYPPTAERHTALKKLDNRVWGGLMVVGMTAAGRR